MSTDKIPVIIDTDPGVDDTLAILLALASPELEILAIIVSYGNTEIHPSYLNVLKIYKVLSQHLERYPEDKHRFPNFSGTKKTILSRGAAGPLEGALHSAQYFHGRDGLADSSERHPEFNCEIPIEHPQLELTDRSGVDVALDLIRSQPAQTVTYMPLGPLTNLALLMRADGDMVRKRIGRIVCMGGALDVPGNTSAVAEFNFFADPFAVRELLTPPAPAQGLPLSRSLLLPLDITTPHELPFPRYAALVDPAFASTAVPSRATGKSPLVHFTSGVLERTRELMCAFGNDALELHDPAAVWCALANPPVRDSEESEAPLQAGWRAVRRQFEVECIGELTRGMLVVDRRDDQGAYDPGANRAESTALPAQVELEHPPEQRQTHTHPHGVPCVVETPGPEALLKLLLARIWGV
ncbi:nucleoside hydrolase [Amylocystis lapponica]|nr:nucleoside hydrolase [Amylocystis lapponica]